tara:strand:+ start:30204 stop:30374 length:171 start_codon:yes stop_codon:yes gene_type:complete
MKLTDDQILGVKNEARMYLVFDPDTTVAYSKYMWNNYKKAVEVEFRGGEFFKATEK